MTAAYPKPCAWAEVPFEEPQQMQAQAAPAPSPPPATSPMVLFLSVPTYSGWVKASGMAGIMHATLEGRMYIELGCASILTVNFNQAFAQALNTRAEGGWTHYGMHHADIAAPPGWADVLERERQRVGADLISAVSPIKDNRRLSSHGAIQPDGGVRRLTLKEVHRLPVTFTTDDLPSIGVSGPLVVNTGLWLMRFDLPFVEELFFHINNGIQKRPDGRFRASMFPEDWFFSNLLNSKGARIAGTTAVRVGHFGEVEFTNEKDDAGHEIDLGD